VADFALTANYKSPSFVGHVVRGGFSSCVGCTTAVEPRYVGTPFDCFYDSNTISLVSLNGFSGDVRLQASGDAALGDATVTVWATSGSIVHTLDLPISVAERLPSC
jgi:hypothetical protein